MRRNLKNIPEVMHFWANEVQEEGAASSVFFERGNLYSYGRHFLIARILPSGTVVFSERGHSVTTSHHKSAARSAARHRPAVFCYDAADSAEANMRHARDAVSTALYNAGKKGIREATRIKFRGEALEIAEKANAYLAALPDDERGQELPIDTANLEAVRAQMLAIEAARTRIREEQDRARLADLRERLANWRKFSVIYSTGFHSLPPALRISRDGSEIETSHGAAIPAMLARHIWRMVQKVRASGHDATGLSYRTGNYTLTLIRADGSIKVGCHDIPYSELQGIAATLGLNEGATSEEVQA